MKILLLGAQGQIGAELRPMLASLGTLTALGREQLDLRDAQALRSRMQAEQPDLLVNAAAYTAVDRAESEAGVAFRINADAVGEMARQMAETGGTLLHYSTDYVFDGQSNQPYREDDATAPINRYGESKLAGEERVRGSGASHLILRTSWVYAHHGHNFLRTMLRLAGERPALRVVDDQKGAPTWARAVAACSVDVLRQCMAAGQDRSWSGTYHLSAAGEATWFDFAREIFSLVPRDAASAGTVVVPIATAQFPTPAARPACSLLDNGKLHRRFGVQMAHWKDSLAQCMALFPC